MNLTEEKYLKDVISEISAEHNRLFGEDSDYNQVSLNENAVKDITMSVWFTIIDLISWVPGLQGFKILKTMGPIKSLKALKAGHMSGKLFGKNLGRLGIKVCGFLIPLASAIQVMIPKQPWTGQTFKTTYGIKLPLIGTENLKGQGAISKAGKFALNTAGFLLEPLNSIVQYSDKMRNAALSITQQMLKYLNAQLRQELSGERGLAKVFNKIMGVLKNTFFNKETDTNSAFCPEFIDLCKQRGIDTTSFAQTMASTYVAYFIKTIAPQCSDENTFTQLLRQNIQNAATYYHLDFNTMWQQVSSEVNVNNTMENTPQQTTQPQGINADTTAPNQGLQAFQEWSQTMFKDQQGQPLQADGLNGPRTRNVVLQFQQWATKQGYTDAQGKALKPDGLWGPNTAYVFQQIQQNNIAAKTQNTTPEQNIAPEQNIQASQTANEIPKINSNSTNQTNTDILEETIRSFNDIFNRINKIK